MVSAALKELAGRLFVCPVGELELLYSARSAVDYDALSSSLTHAYPRADPPSEIFGRALRLQRDLAHHHGMWHRTPIPDLLIAETALHNGFGVIHVDRDFDRISAVRPLEVVRVR
ncbi:MAG: PIN domain-containing protein [Actinomycetota bacterium]